MTINEYSVDAIASYFSNEKLFDQSLSVDQWSCDFKDWILKPRQQDKLTKITSPQQFNASINNHGQYAISLKIFLQNEWERAEKENNHGNKLKLAHWIIKDWGGVIRNNPVTIENHLSIADQLDRTITTKDVPLMGIASSSKIFTLKDPKKYAIYDARVAAALNAILKESKHATKIKYFPHIASRNKVIKEFIDNFDKNADFIERSKTYSEYLNLLNKLKEIFKGYEIYHFEMTLFAKAVDLCAL